MKSGRPTGFLDASEVFRVYHCAGTVNPDPRLVADERRPSVSPWRLGGLSAATLARRVYDGLWAHDLFDRAASLSYYFLFALFPALLFLTAILGLVPGPKLMDHLLDYIARVLPADAASLLSKTLGVPMQVAEAVTRVLQMACDENGPDKDLTTVVQPVERRAGVEVRAERLGAALPK